MKNDFILCLKLNSSLSVTIKRAQLDNERWKTEKKIPLLNSVFYEFVGNIYPCYGLPKLYAALTYFTGPGDNWYDAHKGSYSFTFELVVEKNRVISSYCYHITHYRYYKEGHVPEPFVKFSRSDLVAFGYSSKIKDYFVKKYDDV